MHWWCAVVGGAVIEASIFDCRQRRQGGALIKLVGIVEHRIWHTQKCLCWRGRHHSKGRKIMEGGSISRCCLLGPWDSHEIWLRFWDLTCMNSYMILTREALEIWMRSAWDFEIWLVRIPTCSQLGPWEPNEIKIWDSTCMNSYI